MLQRVDRAEISEQEHGAMTLSLYMKEDANHIVLEVFQSEVEMYIFKKYII